MARPAWRSVTLAMAAGLVLAGAAGARPTPVDYAALVNPLIGTANGGNVFPALVSAK